jgi:predicted acetyltransferase
MVFELKRISYDEKAVLQNLMELYEYDMSEFEEDGHGDVNEFGLYGYKYLDHYWTEEGRHAFFIKVSGKLAGFVLVRDIQTLKDGQIKRSIAEFFIMRKYRGMGAGRFAAHKIFDMFTGTWSVSQLERNLPAQRFWRKIIAEYTNGNFVETHYNGRPAQVFNS